MTLLADICASGRTILMVTHDQRLAAYAHRLVRMQDGRILTEPEPTPAPSAPEKETA